KRVIGIPGDRLHLENGQVIRNGRRLIEPYTQHIAVGPDRYRDNFPQAAPGGSPLERAKCCKDTWRKATWWSRRGCSSPWAIIVKTQRTAVTGGSCPV